MEFLKSLEDISLATMWKGGENRERETEGGSLNLKGGMDLVSL